MRSDSPCAVSPVLCLNPRHVLPPCSLERRATRSLGSPAGNCSSRGKDFKATSDSQVSSSDCTFENPLNIFISQSGSACVFFLPTACFSSQWLSSQVKYIPFAQYILKSMNQKYVLFMKERIEFFFVNKKIQLSFLKAFVPECNKLELFQLVITRKEYRCPLRWIGILYPKFKLTSSKFQIC